MEQFIENDESLMLCTPNTDKKVRFPFFDLPENENSMSRNYELQPRGPNGVEGSGLFTPPPSGQVVTQQEMGFSTPIDSNWESEISPISKNRDSSGGETLDVSSGGLRMTTPTQNEGENLEDIDCMLSELKDIIHQSQKKQKERRGSSISRRRSAETDFLVDALTRPLQSGDSPGPLSPPCEQSGDVTSPLRTPPPTETAVPTSDMNSNDDVSSATKKVNESSNQFIRRMRDEANRRKLSMTRSRDNLKAMQKEKMRPYNDTNENISAVEEVEESDHVQSDLNDFAIADSKGEDEKVINTTNAFKSSKPRKSLSNQSLDSSNTEYHFKARPVPETTGTKGVGGLNGVPKVAKRPLTTPFSPLLGSRRPEKTTVKALQAPKNSIKPASVKKKEKTKRASIADSPNKPQQEDLAPSVFKARPMPSFVGRKGRGGLTGVPKIQKRPLTVPKSPMLGVRRSSSMNEKTSQALREMKPFEESHNSLLSGNSVISRNSDLRGLVVLERPQNTQDNDIVENNENLRPNTHSNMTFQLQSTVRAKQRADYNERRDENMKLRKEQDMKSRQREVRKMEKELMALRTNL